MNIIKAKCPDCGAITNMPNEGWDDLNTVGKYVMTCGECGRFILIRDDGEGPFISSR